MCASLCCRGKPQERDALWRETFESSLGSSKLSPFLKVVRCEGHTERGTLMEGQGVQVHNIQVQQSKAGAAGGEEEAQFPRVLMQQGMTRRRRRGGREREEKKAKDSRSCQGETGHVKKYSFRNSKTVIRGTLLTARHRDRGRRPTEKGPRAVEHSPSPGKRERPWGRDTQREGEGRKDPAPMRDPPLKQQRKASGKRQKVKAPRSGGASTRSARTL